MTEAQFETLLDAKFSYWELGDPRQPNGPGRQWQGKGGNPAPDHHTIRAVSVDASGVATWENLEAIHIGDEWFVIGKDVSSRPDMPESRKPDPARS